VKFYNILNGADYSGMGLYPEGEEAEFENGTKYAIGKGRTVKEAM